MSVTDPFFVRIDAETARLARATAEQRKMPLRELTERALRLYITEVTEPEKRAAAMHAMEEALLGRLDRRLGQHLERVSGLYAREAFDVAQTLDLVKRILTHALRDRELLKTYLEDSRAEATRILKQRINLPPSADPAMVEELKKAREEAAQWKAAAQKVQEEKTSLEQAKSRLHLDNTRLTRDKEDAKGTIQHLEWKMDRIRTRFTWAIHQFEAQRGFTKRPIADFLGQWDRENGSV